MQDIDHIDYMPAVFNDAARLAQYVDRARQCLAEETDHLTPGAVAYRLGGMEYHVAQLVALLDVQLDRLNGGAAK
jgi:hypothetical protein